MKTNSLPPASPGSLWRSFLKDGHGRILAAALLVGAVVALRPLAFYLQSSQEFSLRVPDVLAYTSQVFAFTSACLLPVPVLLSGATPRWRDLVTRLLLALAIGLWLQGYFFLWNYGQLDGRPIDFAAFRWNGVLELAAWAAILLAFLRLNRRVPRLATGVWAVVAGSILASIGMAYASMPPAPWQKQYEFRAGTPFTFSKSRNVIVLTLDSSRGDVFADLLAAMTPQERAAFDGFTFFRNTTGVFTGTIPAVSGILTGQLYDFSHDPTTAFRDMFTSAGSLPLAMKRAGFVSEVYPYNLPSVYLSPAIVDNLQKKGDVPAGEEAAARKSELAKLALVSRFNFAPHFVKEALFDTSEMYAAAARGARSQAPAARAAAGRTELSPMLQGMLDHARWQVDSLRNEIVFRDEPMFKYLHFHGAHPPFFYDENFEGRRMPTTMESYTRQYRGSVLQTTQALVASLKRAGVWDRTMIVILGDHGLHLAREGDGLDVHRRVMDTLRPLLLVKPFGPGETPLRVSSAPVSLFDIPATVMDAVGVAYAGNGRSVLRVREGEHRPRKAYALALSDEDPSAAASGAFVYTVDGDVADPAAWHLENAMLRPNHGLVAVPPEQRDEALADMNDFLGNMNRFSIQD